MVENNKKISGLAIGVLIVSNSLPIFGVLFLEWNLFSILFLYWLENIVVGMYAMLRIWRAELPPKAPIKVTKITGETYIYKVSAYLSFFLVHYGMFTFVHGIFIYMMFMPFFESLDWVLIAFLGLFVSHGISHFKNFVGNQEYLSTSPDKEMLAPYKRVVVMHLTIIAGGFFVTEVGSPIYAIVILVLLKIFIDLSSHLSEHKKYAKSRK